jgi:hypothetical protein
MSDKKSDIHFKINGEGVLLPRQRDRRHFFTVLWFSGGVARSGRDR